MLIDSLLAMYVSSQKFQLVRIQAIHFYTYEISFYSKRLYK